MKIEKIEILIPDEESLNLEEVGKAIKEVEVAIGSVTWGSTDKFLINPIKLGNGVKPIKLNFQKTLLEFGWETEKRMKITSSLRPGPIDVVKETSYGEIAVEWETGNISSSHRALNKMALGVIEGKLIGGILILPNKSFAKYLTDRIGNHEELSVYYPLYKRIVISRGFLIIYVVSYDGLSNEVEFIEKMNDGNSKLAGKKKNIK